MGVPSSQVCSVWVQEELTNVKWILLRDVLFAALKRKLINKSEEYLWDLVEGNLGPVAEHLRDSVADRVVDGGTPQFDIDNDPSPYIRLAENVPSALASKLRRIDPYDFEKVCADVLSALGATSKVTQRSNDGGIDFIGVNLKFVSTGSVPLASTIVVIGQAKRYKEGNAISETQLREFVGAATLRRHQMLKDGNIRPLSPMLLAFWTTSEFDRNARLFARELGLWYMDGITLAAYVSQLGLEASVRALNEFPNSGNTPDNHESGRTLPRLH